MADTSTEVNPADETKGSTEPQLNQDLTEKLTTGVTENEAPKSTSETITEKATAATSAVKDNVFSMFGGGPKKEAKKEDDEDNDRSGSSKAVAAAKGADDVCCRLPFLCLFYANHANRRTKPPKKMPMSISSLSST